MHFDAHEKVQLLQSKKIWLKLWNENWGKIAEAAAATMRSFEKLWHCQRRIYKCCCSVRFDGIDKQFSMKHSRRAFDLACMHGEGKRNSSVSSNGCTYRIRDLMEQTNTKETHRRRCYSSISWRNTQTHTYTHVPVRLGRMLAFFIVLLAALCIYVLGASHGRFLRILEHFHWDIKTKHIRTSATTTTATIALHESRAYTIKWGYSLLSM